MSDDFEETSSAETKKFVPESLNDQMDSEIKVLKGLEAVRMRPGMYIGDANVKGLHQLVYEVVDNSIDEALAGFCKNIEVTIGIDNSITVTDDGRGIPVAMHPTEHKPQCEVALTMLHAGGKFDKEVYKFSGGLHGVGVSCVNALSEWLVLTICRDGKKYQMRFSRGKTTTELHELGPSDKRGTIVQYKPDPEIFEVLTYNYEILAKRLRELAYLNAGISITLTDVRGADPRSETFHFQGGVAEFVGYLNQGKLTPPQAGEKKMPPPPPVISFSGETTNFRSDGTGDFWYDVSFQYNFTYNETIYSFVNGINTSDGGTHLSGFLTAFTTAINNYAKKAEEEELKKKGGKVAAAAGKKKGAATEEKENKDAITSEDVRKGLSAVVSVKVENPLFESQTKTKLNNPEINGLMRTATTNAIKAYFEEHPDHAKWIVDRTKLAAKARRDAAEAIRKVMGTGETSVAKLLGKLSDCSSKDPSQCELYIVEGDSAGGSAKSGRESAYQAILPIRGKLINAEKASIEKLLRNEEIRTIVTAIGAGSNFGGDDSQIDISKARYHRIVIMTDADVDGSHIRTLVLTFLFRHLRPLVEAGYVYVARPPLFKMMRGKQSEYVETEDDRNMKLTNFGIQNLALRIPGKEVLPPEDISSIIQTIRECLRLCDINLPRYSIRADEFLKLRQEHGEFPSYMVELRVDGVPYTKFAWSKEEAERLVQEANAKANPVPTEEETEPAEEQEAPEEEEAPKEATAQYDEDGNLISAPEEQAPTSFQEDNHWTYIPEAVALENLAKSLLEKQLSIDTLYDREGDNTPVMELIDEKTSLTTTVTSLHKLCEEITKRGSKDVTFQRYKGLGEMDASELWETTMNPETRWMIRITVEDAAAADETFNLLMGDEVLPRRRFIENNADRVLNPDI